MNSYRFLTGVLKRILPNSFIQAWRHIKFRRLVRKSFLYDANRYSMYAYPSDDRPRSIANLRAMITMYYHAIEKGLAHPHPRPGFGAKYISGLIPSLKNYVRLVGRDETVDVSLSALDHYFHFNRLNDLPFHDEFEAVKLLRNELPTSVGQVDQCDARGTIELTRDVVLSQSKMDLSGFFSSRYSTRNFSSLAVDPDLIKKAVEMAQKTPSVCNRQSWRVHIYSTPEKKDKILTWQWGNRGFGHLASHVLLISTDLRCFTSERERFQGWIDGGMFSMSLIYALHSLGIACCSLNCSTDPEFDRSLHEAGDLDGHELIIMMIAIGNYQDRFEVARSARRQTDDLAVWH